MVAINLTTCEQGFYHVETKCLNGAGYIPVVSSFSGAIRGIFGKALIITAIVFTAIFLYQALRQGNEEKFALAKRSGMLAMHGVCNILRGAIELLPLGGLLLCVPYDFYLKKRFCYPEENQANFQQWLALWVKP